MKKLRKYYIIAKVSFSNAIAYKASVISRFVFYTMFIYVFMCLWRAIYREGSVNGYGYTQMVWYLITTEFIGFVCGTGVYTAMNDDIKSGSIAYQLGRPTHYIFYQLAYTIGQVLLNFVCFGALASVLGLIFVGPLPSFSFAVLPPLLLSISLSVLLNYFVMMLIGLSSFVLEDNFALFLIYQKLSFMLGVFLPVEFLPSWLQPVAKSLPFSYIFWAPAKIFVNYSPQLCWELIPKQAAWTAAVTALVFLSYRVSIRRLQINGG